MPKEVFFTVAKHPTAGHVFVMTSIEDAARDTGTRVEEWHVEGGWVPIEEAKRLPILAELILAGRLKIREV